MPLTLTLNGKLQTFDLPAGSTSLSALIEHLGLKADRIAIERNGELAPRTTWSMHELATGDRVEIVHFVGGGCLGVRKSLARE